MEYAPRFISKDKILEIVKKIGYSPLKFDSAEKKAVNFDLYLRFIIAAFFSLNIMMFSYPIYASYFTQDRMGDSRLFAWISLFASLPVLLYSAQPIVKRFLNALKFGFIGMEALIVIGVSSAFGLSLYELLHGGEHVYFDSMSVIITFVLLGKIIESKAKFSTKETLLRLSKSLPKRGRKRFADQRESFVSLKSIEKGDFLVVLSGEKIVLDGVVTEGEGACDESIMTGESIPLRKRLGDKVLSGTILCQGRLVYRVESTEEETTLHQIITLIERDIGHKSSYVRAVDPLVRFFVPVVLFLSFITAIWFVISGHTHQEAIVRAFSVLLISCPCAIGIAAPLAESQTLHEMANLGAIIRNRACLAILGKEDVFVFDKTGTITEGRFHVLSGLDVLSQKEKSILKGMVQYTVHPIAIAIGRKLSDSDEKLEFCEEVIGKGLHAFCKGHRYDLGSRGYMNDLGLETSVFYSERGYVASEVYFAVDKKLITKIVLGDELKKDARQTIALIKPVQTVLLSGDSKECVEAVSEKCGFDTWHAAMTPLEKRNFIDEIRKDGKVVCMMGDGINDAPALTGADIGISVVTAADLSIQVSDILLTTDRLEVVAKIRFLARKGQSILKQNLFWAFFYNVAGIGFAMVGALNPLMSAAAMVISSLIVLVNAKRLSL